MVEQQRSNTLWRDAFAVGKAIWRADGVLGFYRGGAVYVIGGMPSQLAYFLGYNRSKELLLSKLKPLGVPDAVVHGAAGIVADIVGE